MKLSVEEALARGVAAQKQGRLQEAEQVYKAVLQAVPDNAEANYNLGLLAASVHKFRVACFYFKGAIDASPEKPEYWVGYIEALIDDGQVEQARKTISSCSNKDIAPSDIDRLRSRSLSLSNGKTTSGPQQRKLSKQSKKRRKDGRKKNRDKGPTEEEVKDLLSLFGTGQLGDAETLARSMSERFPKHPFAWKVLGAVLKQAGKNQDALAAMKTSARLAPQDAEAHNNLGSTFLALGKLKDAESSCKRAIDLKPDYPEAFFNLGIVLQESQRHVSAEKFYKKAISHKPDYIEAHYNLGITQQTLKKYTDAETSYKNALAINPNLARAHNNIGVIRQKTGSLNDAIVSYELAIEIDDEYPEAHNNLGTAFKDLGSLEIAESCYRKAISLNPTYSESLNNLGVVLQELGRFEEAETNYKRAIELKPGYVEARINRGNAFHQAARFEKAVASYEEALEFDEADAEIHNYKGSSLLALGKLSEAKESYLKALSLNTHSAEVHNNLGVTLQGLGEIREAEERYREAISINPLFAEAHRHLATIKKYSYRDSQFLKMQDLNQSDGITVQERCHINFGLAKACEDIEEIQQAFIHYNQGNSLRKDLLGYDVAKDLELFDQIKWTHPRIGALSIEKEMGAETPVPIFIIGMPRSGTTLVEQIISSHPLVAGGGELPFVAQFGGPMATGMSTVSEKNLSIFREKYLQELKVRAKGKRYVTDKMPLNFRFAGLITAALPEAKIVHVKRDSRATCWSNYKHYFTSNDIGYCYALEDTVSYFQSYEDLMKFWNQSLRKCIYDLDYDQLTADQERETRLLIAYLGLEWDEICLSPEKNERGVVTASNIQVRHKVYRDSSLQWKKYLPFLREAFKHLS